MTCSRCATINPDGATICASCGAPLVMGAPPPPAAAYMPPPGAMPPGAMPYGYGMAPPMPQRSSIPKVMGILMIVFGALGLLVSLAGLAGPRGADEFKGIAEWDRYVTMSKVFAGVDSLIAIVDLVGGIMLIGYKRSGLTLAYAYGALRIIAWVVELSLVYVWLVPAIKDAVPEAANLIGAIIVITGIVYSVWPLLVLILVSRPSARQACVN